MRLRSPRTAACETPKVSFDLYVFDLDHTPSDIDKIHELIEDGSRWGDPLSPKLLAFVTELESAYPGLDDDPDGSPWSSWPLDGNSMVDGQCCGFNIGWSHAEVMLPALTDACVRHQLTLYDPQTGGLVEPTPASGPAEKRGWWRRLKRG